MKSKVALGFLLAFSLTTFAFAKAKPILEEVVLKNSQFSKIIYQSLANNIQAEPAKMLAGGKMNVITIANAFSCLESGSGAKVKYTCAILADAGWNALGSESYGAGDNEELTKSLYEAMSEKPEVDEFSSTKTIELNATDKEGGTERNQLTCMMATELAQGLGLTAYTCQIMNAL